jgi:FkbM family methyltransferase
MSCQVGPSDAVPDRPWTESIRLPNGLSFWLPSKQIRPAAEYLIREIFLHRRYFRDRFGIRRNDTIVDIGANMGLFTLWAAPQAPGGRLLAIEPGRAVDCLAYNVQANRLGHVTAIPAAVGKQDGQIDLIEYPGFNLVSHPLGLGPAWITRLLIFLRYFRVRSPTRRRTAPCRSLGGLIDEHKLSVINFLKVDCEGAEYEIFRSLADEHWSRIERVAMEFHELRPGDRHPELVWLFQQHGFRVEIRKPWFQFYLMRFGELWAWRE